MIGKDISAFFNWALDSLILVKPFPVLFAFVSMRILSDKITHIFDGAIGLSQPALEYLARIMGWTYRVLNLRLFR